MFLFGFGATVGASAKPDSTAPRILEQFIQFGPRPGDDTEPMLFRYLLLLLLRNSATCAFLRIHFAYL